MYNGICKVTKEALQKGGNMEKKIKKAIQLLALIEQLVIKIISLAGWLLILVRVMGGG